MNVHIIFTTDSLITFNFIIKLRSRLFIATEEHQDPIGTLFFIGLIIDRPLIKSFATTNANNFSIFFVERIRSHFTR